MKEDTLGVFIQEVLKKQQKSCYSSSRKAVSRTSQCIRTRLISGPTTMYSLAHGMPDTSFVVGLTAIMMVGEIVVGWFSGSMALLADGWHMATHAAALGIAALAYLFARRQAGNSRFTFGTGKFGDLAAFFQRDHLDDDRYSNRV
jgi:hypothetical protein